MGDETMNKEYPDNDQRHAVCNGQTGSKTDSPAGIVSAIARFSGGGMWACEPAAIKKIRSALGAVTLSGRFHEARYDPMAVPVEMTGTGIAVVTVKGMVMRDPSYFSWLFGDGFVDPDRLAETVGELSRDSSVRGVLLNVDSPGGEIAGMLACAEAIYRARDSKPVWSWTPYTMASAAYAFGSACGKVLAVPDARVGSVGIIYTHCDFSPSNNGFVVVSEFVSGRWKALGSEDRAPSDEERGKIQSHVDKAANMLFGMVGRYRNISPDQIRALEADIFDGREAMDRGLSDSVAGTLNDALAMMLEEVGSATPNQGDGTMAVDIKELRKKFPGVNEATLRGIVGMTLNMRGQEDGEEMPKTESECKDNGMYWYDDACHKEPQSGGEGEGKKDGGDGGTKAAETEKTQYTDQASCEEAGFTWKDGKCWETMTEETTTTKTTFGRDAVERIGRLEATVEQMNREMAAGVWETLFADHPALTDDQRADMKSLVCPKKHMRGGMLDRRSYQSAAEAKLKQWVGTSTSGFNGGGVELGGKNRDKGYSVDDIKRIKNS